MKSDCWHNNDKDRGKTYFVCGKIGNVMTECWHNKDRNQHTNEKRKSHYDDNSSREHQQVVVLFLNAFILALVIIDGGSTLVQIIKSLVKDLV